jgi:hypothetical protein
MASTASTAVYIFGVTEKKEIDQKVNRLAKMRVDGSGPPFVKIRGTILYDLDSVDEWLAERTFRSTSTA